MKNEENKLEYMYYKKLTFARNMLRSSLSGLPTDAIEVLFSLINTSEVKEISERIASVMSGGSGLELLPPRLLVRNVKVPLVVEDYFEGDQERKNILNLLDCAQTKTDLTSILLGLNERPKHLAKIALLDYLEQKIKVDYVKKGRPYNSFEQLRAAFHLDDVQLNIIILLYIFAKEEPLWGELGARGLGGEGGFFELIANCLGVKQKEVRRNCYYMEADLRKKGLIIGTFHKCELSMSIFDFLDDENESKTLLETFFEEDKVKPKLGLSDFFFKQSEEIALRSLTASEGKKILLVGPPGVGKTETARLLSCEANKRAFVMKNYDASNSANLGQRQAGLAALGSIGPSKGAVYICDEADKLLETRVFWGMQQVEDNKSYLNDWLTRSPHTVIFITNEIRQICPSTLRRFSMVVKFPLHGLKERETVILGRVKERGLELESNRVREIAASYCLSAGDLVRAVDDSAELSAGGGDANKSFVGHMETLCESKSKAYGRPIKKSRIPRNYDISALNLSVPPENLEKKLKANMESETPTGVCVLLSGPPGVGKSLLGHWLGRRLNKEVQVKSSADVLGSLVGQSEAKIKEMFSSLSRSGGITVLDEGELLLGSRKNAHRRWEASITNQFLQEMEQLENGIFICTSNFFEDFDHAILRRFHFKLKLDYLTPGGVVKMAMKWFVPLSKSELSTTAIERLTLQNNLTPGDFKAVATQFMFEEEVSNDELVRALLEEVSYKKKRPNIGLKSSRPGAIEASTGLGLSSRRP